MWTKTVAASKGNKIVDIARLAMYILPGVFNLARFRAWEAA